MLTKKLLLAALAILLLAHSACKKEPLTYSSGDIKVNLNVGKHWLHSYPLFLGISKLNPPQLAIWLEDTNGRYLTSVYVTYKIARQGWIANNGNRRKEALPHWCHQRGVLAPDGLYLPTKSAPLPDGITGATPKASKELKLTLASFSQPLVVKVEVNHSTDFNSYYTKDASPNTPYYSGGSGGSGQPSLIYAATITPSSSQPVTLTLVGHGSPDGSDGKIYPIDQTITSALSIVGSITVQLTK